MKNTIYPCLLDVLPIEIIIQILASLDYRQLLRCRSVSIDNFFFISNYTVLC